MAHEIYNKKNIKQPLPNGIRMKNQEMENLNP